VPVAVDVAVATKAVEAEAARDPALALALNRPAARLKVKD